MGGPCSAALTQTAPGTPGTKLVTSLFQFKEQYWLHEHVPSFWPTATYSRVLHELPVYQRPGKGVAHVQVLGLVQVPPFWHGGEQVGIEQMAPLQPELHVHVLGAVHTPFIPHPRPQKGVRQVVPVQPGEHEQLLGLAHTPLPQPDEQTAAVHVVPLQPL